MERSATAPFIWGVIQVDRLISFSDNDIELRRIADE
jgi:hypothetical protein